ncbi:MAG: GW dipeptide domain-containing protein [Cyclobacteriaceae bacterium]|nr:GW dipeptide domain-containing protein [Cyclobacteriaceae bacterium]
MRYIMYFMFFSLIMVGLSFSCSSDVKKFEGDRQGQFSGGDGLTESHEETPGHSNMQETTTHHVEVLEIVQTSSYSYLRVKEKEAEFWVATVKGDFVVGEQYKYQGGILMKDFKSKELDRVFDEVFFLEYVIPAKPVVQNNATTGTEKAPTNKPVEGVVSLIEIINNPDDYKGKQVRVYGEVVKINLNIMSRNWIHIKDGTADEHDFVITSDAQAPLGESVVFEGLISVDKDFGAGYIYSLIMEEARVVE